MLLDGQRGGRARHSVRADLLWPRPVNQADVLVSFVDAVNVEKAWRDERSGAGRSRGRTLAKQFHVEAALLFRFTQRGLLRVFVQFNVSAKRQPLVQLAMVNQQNLFVVNNKDRDGEINFFVDVGHALATIFNNKAAKARRKNFPNDGQTADAD